MDRHTRSLRSLCLVIFFLAHQKIMLSSSRGQGIFEDLLITKNRVQIQKRTKVFLNL